MEQGFRHCSIICSGGGGIFPLYPQCLLKENLFNILFKHYFYKNTLYGIAFSGYEYECLRDILSSAKPSKKIPLICLTRDPLSIVLSSVNQNLMDIYRQKIIFHKDISIPSKEALFLKHLEDKRCLMHTPNLELIKPFISETIMLKTEDIIGEVNTQKTLKKLFSTLNQPPLEELPDYNVSFNNTLSRSFPHSLILPCYHREILVSLEYSLYRYYANMAITPQKHFVLLYRGFFKGFSKEIFIYVPKVSAKRLKQLQDNTDFMQCVFIHTKDFLDKVSTLLETEKRCRVTREDMEGWLENHKEYQEKLKLK